MSNATQAHPIHAKMTLDHLKVARDLAILSRQRFLAYLIQLAITELHEIEHGRETKL